VICSARCFETSEIQDLAANLFNRPYEKNETPQILTSSDGDKIPMASAKTIKNLVSLADRLAFLPAPYTWIEFEWKDVERCGWLLVDNDHEGPFQKPYYPGWITAIRCTETESDFMMSFPKRGDPTECIMHGDGAMTEDERITTGIFLGLVIANLALINTPKIIGRTTHLPHRRLEKELARAFKKPGKYPLQAWHEIKLHVAVPPEFKGDFKEAHLTGMRALHFCRAHLRIRLGQVEFVSWHWRGNPAMGIKQTRYLVTK
jgi:hypothetical protein